MYIGLWRFPINWLCNWNWELGMEKKLDSHSRGKNHSLYTSNMVITVSNNMLYSSFLDDRQASSNLDDVEKIKRRGYNKYRYVSTAFIKRNNLISTIRKSDKVSDLSSRSKASKSKGKKNWIIAILKLQLIFYVFWLVYEYI